MSFSIKKVLITESVDPQCAEILSKNGIEVTTKVGLSKDDLLKEIKDYDGLVVRSATKVTAEVIEAASSLKVVGRAGTGVDNVDCVAASRRGVLVINAPGGNSISAAELTCGMIYSLARHIPQGDASMKAGRWDRKLYMGSEVHGKTLAIVGLGRIGREVANTMQAAGMVTIGYDPLVPAEESIKFGVKSYPLEEIWPLADYITVHVPLIKQTKGLIDSRVLGICKKGVKIVNCARGGIVDEEALLAALESGQCGGAGLDVYCQEPPQNTALVQHPRVVATPHLGASTVEAQSRVALEIAEQFVDLTHGRNVPGVVNSREFCQMLSPDHRGWVALSQRLARLAVAVAPQEKKLQVSASDMSRAQLLKLAALVGMLPRREANAINAAKMAEDQGLEVEVVQRENSGRACCPVHMTVSSAGVSLGGSLRRDAPYLSSVAGALFCPPVEMPHCGSLLLAQVDAPNCLKLQESLEKAGLNMTSVHRTKVQENNKVWMALYSMESGLSLPAGLDCHVAGLATL